MRSAAQTEARGRNPHRSPTPASAPFAGPPSWLLLHGGGRAARGPRHGRGDLRLSNQRPAANRDRPLQRHVPVLVASLDRPRVGDAGPVGSGSLQRAALHVEIVPERRGGLPGKHRGPVVAASLRDRWTAALDRRTALQLAAGEYDRFLALLRSLTPEDWTRSTDCPGWDFRAMAGHVLGQAEMVASVRQLAVQSRAAARAGGDVDAVTAHQVQAFARLSRHELVGRFAAVAARAVRGPPPRHAPGGGGVVRPGARAVRAHAPRPRGRPDGDLPVVDPARRDRRPGRLRLGHLALQPARAGPRPPHLAHPRGVPALGGRRGRTRAPGPSGATASRHVSGPRSSPCLRGIRTCGSRFSSRRRSRGGCSPSWTEPKLARLRAEGEAEVQEPGRWGTTSTLIQS